MEKKIIAILLLLLLLTSCQKPPQVLPPITEDHIKRAQEIEETLNAEILEGKLVEAMEREGEGELKERGFLFGKLMSRLIRLILPDHLTGFVGVHKGLTEKTGTFAEYRGIFGRCHQFRVFYKYNDSRVEKVEWASSILSVPVRGPKNIQAGVVLAPSLDGFTPLIESGLWLKLCRKGIATLTPESLFRKREGLWEKLHFDPTPPYNSVDEYTLYEDSIRRYEKILTQNISILRSIKELKTDQNDRLSDLEVMDVNPSRVGFWGSSFGAVVGSLVVAKDPEIKASVLSVGGGDLPYVISHSKISLFKDTRQEQMKLLGLKSVADYQSFISQYIQSEPLSYAKASDSSRLFMVLARRDKSVPTAAQYQLYEKFGRPKKSSVRGGHVLTLLLTSWISNKDSRRPIRFLVEKLQQQPLD